MMDDSNNSEEFDLDSVLKRATKSKGMELTGKEISKFEELCADIAELEMKVKEQQIMDDEAEAKEFQEAAELVVQHEVYKAQQEPKTEEKIAAIIAEKKRILTNLQFLGLKVDGEEENKSNSSEQILDYYVWVENWLRSESNSSNIEESLDCYIEQYSLLTTNPEDEDLEIKERRLKCEILTRALENINSAHWEIINDHLRKSQKVLILLEEKDARWAKIDRTSNNTISIAHDTELTDEDSTDMEKLHMEMDELSQQMRAGTIESKAAIARLDEIEYRLGLMGNTYSRVLSRLKKLFRHLFRLKINQ